MPHQLSRRQVVQGAGAVGLALLAGCGRLPGQAPPARRIARLGWLRADRAADRIEAVTQGLRDLGYVPGQHFTVEERHADGSEERLLDFAAELVALPVDIILAAGTQAALAAKQATTTVPIVMVSSDPVGSGLVASLARPGGNVTGVTGLAVQLAAKRLELLTAVLPGASRVAVLWNPADPPRLTEFQETQGAAEALGVRLQSLEVQEAGELAAAFAAATLEGAEALIVLGDPFTVAHRTRIVELAAQSRLPAMYRDRPFVEAGGLMGYGANPYEPYRRLATYVDKILKGARPADLPVEQPMRFDFVINATTAHALGLTIPPHVLLQATEVIP